MTFQPRFGQHRTLLKGGAFGSATAAALIESLRRQSDSPWFSRQSDRKGGGSQFPIVLGKDLTVSKIRFVCIVGSFVPLLTIGSAAAGQHEWHQSQTLIDVVREATAQFVDPQAALAAGYVAKPFCVTGPDQGAMGVHFVNATLVKDGKLDQERPEALIYESKNGRLRLVAVEYIVFADAWNTQNPQPPVISGQLLNYIAAPNRFGNPNFYELHVWAWKDNPFGAFVDWNPRVSCAEHSPDN